MHCSETSLRWLSASPLLVSSLVLVRISFSFKHASWSKKAIIMQLQPPNSYRAQIGKL